jgi:methylglyoxal synthase
MNIALIAHDQKKNDLVQFVTAYQTIFAKHTLFATGTTGTRINEATGLDVTRFKSGPLGGDQQIGALIAQNQMDAIFFFRDPLTAQPNMGTAELLIRGLELGLLEWRNIVKENGEVNGR